MEENSFELVKRVLQLETQGIDITSQIVLLLIETVFVLVPGLLLLKKNKITVRKLLYVYLLVIYLGIILSFTIFRRPAGSREGIVNLYINLGFGLRGNTPSLWSSAFSVLNILLFIPWGMIIYPLIQKKRRLVGVVLSTLIGTLTSVCIECLQLITGTGMFEVTDMVTNTAGTFIGAVFISILLKNNRVGKTDESSHG